MHKRQISFIILSFSAIISLVSINGVNEVAAQSQNDPSPAATSITDTDNTINLPLIFRPVIPTQPPPPAEQKPKTIFCSTSPSQIPDNVKSGITNTITIDNPGYIGDIDLRFDIDHTWIGDLKLYLTHEDTGTTITVMNRPGFPADEHGCALNNMRAILDDEVSLPVERVCSSYHVPIEDYLYSEVAIAGTYLPEEELSIFDNELISGNWTVTASDLNPHDEGKLNQWCLTAELHDGPVTPFVPPSPENLPDQALIPGVTGQSQALPLDCESRSAVDWAKYFGVWIDELKFYQGLPDSENPDLGFVGNVYGTWGQLPPNPYGVHAEPVAARLRKYGLSAAAHRPFSWNALRAEIAAGRPVIAWIVGSKYPGTYDYVVNGIPEYYPIGGGMVTVAARYEHTVIVTGYSPDSVTYLNGGGINKKGLKQFLESWSVLGNMVITLEE
jgi:subtilisin-like proprotein convertase family protein/uncharacterized protein YvpB